MKRIGVIIKRASNEAKSAAGGLEAWLKNKDMEVFFHEPAADKNSSRRAPDSSLPPDLDLVVVLGGDGTLLYAARLVGQTGTPLLGVNLGGLGFLTEISMIDLYPTLDKVLRGEFTVDSRMMLAVELKRKQTAVARETVLNDAVINKAALARILELKVKINGEDLTTFRADGLIISTPTGSTAYNLSAGGPIVHPAQETILLTPICPFTLTNRPLILPESVEIEVEMDARASDMVLTLDGQAFYNLEPGDLVRVSRARTTTAIIKSPYKGYFEILKTKLGWG